MRDPSSEGRVPPADSDVDATVLLALVDQIVGSGDPRDERARAAAEVIQRATDARWVGIYDVGSADIAVLGWHGPSAPAHPRFPRGEGLSGAAVQLGHAVVVGDVSSDQRYLPTLSDTRSEVIVPITRAGTVCGTLDVESDRPNAFGAERVALLEDVALALAGLWAAPDVSTASSPSRAGSSGESKS